MKLRSRALAALACGCVVALAIPSAASARAVVSRLHVEAAGTALAGGTSYVNDSARIRTSRRQPECAGSGDTERMSGPTALGILDYADNTNRRLRPVEVSDRFDFGLLVCGIGGHRAFSASRFWLYKVDHRSATVASDQFRLRNGDDVLWYLVDTVAGQNTGSELDLVAPARARPGEEVGVQVLSYDEAGNSTPAAGATVSFGQGSVVTGADGTARFTPGGFVTLRATRGPDIPSMPVPVCVNSDLDRCPERRGSRIVGTNRAERLSGGAGGDTVVARGGNDRINIRRGDIDRADCGGGRDVVLLSRNDRADRDCERRIRR
jgi:hypothetical protein